LPEFDQELIGLAAQLALAFPELTQALHVRRDFRAKFAARPKSWRPLSQARPNIDLCSARIALVEIAGRLGPVIKARELIEEFRIDQLDAVRGDSRIPNTSGRPLCAGDPEGGRHGSFAASYCGIPRGKFLRHFALKGRTTSLRHLRELVIQSVIDGLASLILLTIAAVIIHRKSCGNPYEDDEQFERDL